MGLNWHDYHARNYDASLGRTMTMDPLADKFVTLSPYSFLNNSPLRTIDPTGAAAVEAVEADEETAKKIFERLKNEINSKGDKKREDEEEEEEEVDFDYKRNDCNGCPSTFRHKNREVITNQENGKDYMLYDNQWHQLPEQKIFEKFYPDSEHPKGGMTLTRTREELFINNYIAETVNNSFFKGALGIGTITGFIQGLKKASPLYAIFAGAEESFRNTKSLFDRMESHDQEVERNLNSIKK